MSSADDKWVWFDEPEPRPKSAAGVPGPGTGPLVVSPLAPLPDEPAGSAASGETPAPPGPAAGADTSPPGLAVRPERESDPGFSPFQSLFSFEHPDHAAPKDDLRELLWGASPGSPGLADPFAPMEWPDLLSAAKGPDSHPEPPAAVEAAPPAAPLQSRTVLTPAPEPPVVAEASPPAETASSPSTPAPEPPAAAGQHTHPAGAPEPHLHPALPPAKPGQTPPSQVAPGPVEPLPLQSLPSETPAAEPEAGELRTGDFKLAGPQGKVVLTPQRPASARPELRPLPANRPEPVPAPAPPPPPAGISAAPAETAPRSSALVKAILLHLEGKIDEAMKELNAGLLAGENPVEMKAALGNLLYEAGKLDEAARHYREVLNEQPHHPGIHYKLGVCLHRLGQRQEALVEFGRAAQLSTTDWEARLAMGVLLLELGRPEEALPRFEECVAARPREIAGLLGRGIALEQAGRILDAESTYRAALRLDPSSKEARENLLSICLAREATAEARVLASELLAADPGSRHAREALISLNLSEKNFLQARDLSESLVRDEPGFFEGWFNYGVCLRACGDAAGAAAAFGEAARLAPGSLEAQLAYGLALREGGDSAGARKVISDALDKTPGDPRLMVAMASLAFESGDLAALERIVLRIPSGSLPKPAAEALDFQYGCLLLESGDLEGATRVFDACLKRRPDWSAARLNQALALWRSGDPAEARKLIEAVPAGDPRRPEALYALGHLAIESENYQEALDRFTELIGLGERSAALFYNTGLLHQHFGRPDEALLHYGEALKENPALSEALERMGQVASAMGRNEEAREYWKKAKEPIRLGGLAPAGA